MEEQLEVVLIVGDVSAKMAIKIAFGRDFLGTGKVIKFSFGNST
jgi:hypothetical protein